MPTPADVTVVVCSRNREDMLRAAISAIESATPPETDVLVVDSASDGDGTRRVAAEAGVACVRSGRGLSVARNVGITTASRSLVVFTDDDCRPKAGWIERLCDRFDDPAVLAVTGRMLDHTTGLDAPYSRPERYERPISGLDAGHGAVMAFRREVLLRLGGFDDVLGAGQRHAGAEDLDIFIRVLRAGGVVEHEGDAVVLHANTRVGDAYVELYRGYGRGLGALVGKWMRLDPWLGIRLGWILVGRTTRRILGSRRDSSHDRALLAGLAEGAWDTRRIPLFAERFVPPWEPTRMPVLLAEGAVA
ncbi:glycosyltransferase family 2 protein [Microbacterium ulmi]|uniref:Glycosyltransferase n=1 Tax=Microbacterium ulmi TaxID=179095 RepID=A0A7Y2Q2A6_9MICO|nr:glycosyltransferase [Microbacterium ulmi]NII69465.1 glycosyltransferase involved in cell wall biosynthesis [Microbacterium ulmi]NNH04423.1 glycosyltransferase [Microbacterium ulmi]